MWWRAKSRRSCSPSWSTTGWRACSLMRPILTIGHSNHPLDRFLKLIADTGVQVIADVRTTPQSRYNPHFGQKPFAEALKVIGVDYVFFGDSLGGRPKDESVWRDGRPDYTRMALTNVV